jgi:thiol-disulfide isomerase/thioredoxin
MHAKATMVTKQGTPLAPKFHKTELDWDWDVSSKIISSGISFDEVLKSHDFTFINFYADWCSHCKAFSKTWNTAEERTDKKTFKDADGNELTVKMLRMNCVEFSKQCGKINVRYYPTVRVYKPDGTFIPFEGKRDVDSLVDFIEDIVGKSHHVNAFGDGEAEKQDGCRMTGSVEILRVPSEFHFQVKAQDKSLVASLTNVSHEVHQIIFADTDIEGFTKLVRRLPDNIIKNLNPLSNKKFIATRNNESPQHFFQVVSTNYYDNLVYQVTAQSHMKEEDRHAIPKAKFSYTISPMTVDISYIRKPFYQFLTSVCALLGGAYTIIRVLYGATDFVAKKYKAQVGKLG